MKRLKIKYHNIVANYFGASPLFFDYNLQEKPNVRKCMELPYQQMEAEQWQAVTNTLCDFKFLQSKVISRMAFDLVRDFNDVLVKIPENAEKIKQEKVNNDRLELWIRELTKYSLEWNKRRDGTTWWKRPKVREPLLPIPPETFKMCPSENIKSGHNINHMTLSGIDKLYAFSSFVRAECYHLYNFGNHPGFVLQHTMNCMPYGPVQKTAKEYLSDFDGPFLLRCWPKNEIWNQKSPLISTLIGHNDSVQSVDITPDGRIAVSGSNDKTIRVWDIKSLICLRILVGHTDTVNSVKLTPDGRMAVSGSSDKTLRVWNLENWNCLRIISGHTDAIMGVSITPDGRRAVSVSLDKSLRIWDLKNGHCIRKLVGHTDRVHCVDITPDGRKAVSGGADKSVKIWDLERGNYLGIPGHDWTITSVKVTLNGLHILSVSRDKSVRIRDLEGSGFREKIIGFHDQPLETVCMTPDSKRAASAGFDHTIEVWDLASKRSLRVLLGHTGIIWSVSITADGRRLVSGSDDCTVKIWDLESDVSASNLEGHDQKVTRICVTKNEQLIATASYDSTVRIWDLKSAECIRILNGHSDIVNCLALTPSDGHYAMSSSSLDSETNDFKLQVWDWRVEIAFILWKRSDYPFCH